MPGRESPPTTLVTPTLLPCSITPGTTTFDGQLWSPQATEAVQTQPADGGAAAPTTTATTTTTTTTMNAPTQITAYFRGRRLVGQEIPLPEGCRGIIPDQAKLAEGRRLRQKAVPVAPEVEVVDLEEDEDETADLPVDLPRVEAQYRFDSVRILSHDVKPSEDSPAMRAMKEWASMARSIHQH